MFDDNKSVDDRLRELHRTRFGHDYEQIFKSIAWTPAHDLIRFQDTVNEIKASAHRAGWELIKLFMAHDLSLATAESLTGGLIFSTLVDMPLGEATKYGCFSVYDTDAKRIFLGVTAPDLYTHRCATEMAVGVLKNSNASFAIAVTGNAMPYQGIGEQVKEEVMNLGEVFIACAAYGKDGSILVKSKMYNFTEPKHGGYNASKDWILTVHNENLLNEALQQNGINIQNEGFSKLHDGFNNFLSTGHISEFIRNQTCLHAYLQAIEFIVQYRQRIASISELKEHGIIDKIDYDTAKMSLMNQINNGGTNNLILSYNPRKAQVCQNVQLLTTKDMNEKIKQPFEFIGDTQDELFDD